MRDVDVAVVGAGLAGLTAARLAAAKGLRVLLGERKPRVDTGVRTTGIFVRRTLADLAFPEGTLGPPVREIRLLGPALRGFTVTAPREEFRVGRMAPLYSALAESAARAGAQVRLGTRFLGLAL